MLQATANHQCPIWSFNSKQKQIAKYFHGTGGTNYTHSTWKKGGVSIHSTIKKTVETLNDVSLKFEKNHILP